MEWTIVVDKNQYSSRTHMEIGDIGPFTFLLPKNILSRKYEHISYFSNENLRKIISQISNN